MYANNDELFELKEFLKKQLNEMQDKSLSYCINKREVDEVYLLLVGKIKERFFKIEHNKKQAEGKAKQVGSLEMTKALRYLSFQLADDANHKQAKEAAILNNYYRTIYWKQSGNRRLKRRSRLFGFFTGYLERPKRLILTILLVWFLFTTFYGIITICGGDDYSSIVFSEDKEKTVTIWHYAYFSAVTLTTLGYGDLAPNHSENFPILNIIVKVLCSAEAFFGYAILGLTLAVLINAAGIHSFGRMSKWLNEYEKRMNLY